MKKSKELKRCHWANSSEMMAEYHDSEWGVPVRNDRKHFEFLILEGAQAGLSWATILKRRKGYAKAFANFDPKKVSKFTKVKINSLLKDPGIIRNRLKIESAVHNAKLFLDVQKEFGSFDAYAWQFVGGKQVRNKNRDLGDFRATSVQSDAFSKDLKKRGFKFVGSTVIYAHMQAVGMVNDHLISCFRYKQCSF
ncbi:MAG: DNA-3-methyladenine glycosylase I [Bdellovibrionaceae bacterium]|nr:DNA-3-methyladenine glycosylase I [Pseudobdellovibrionaceae bacterium]